MSDRPPPAAPAAQGRTATRRMAWRFTWVHAGLIVASILAFWFIVDQPMPKGQDPVLYQRAYDIGMRWTGPLYIATGFAAALCGLIALLGAQRGWLLSGVVMVVSLVMELLGTSTGFPFGPYGYGDALGPKVADLVPLVIPLSWFLMLYASLGVAYRFQRSLVGTSVIAALGLVGWDVLMDPTMSAVFPFWSWHTGGIYYGMPLVNWAGWFLTGLLIALAATWLGGRQLEELAGERLTYVLYALNGLFPLGLALRDGLWGAIGLGGGLMVLYLMAPQLMRLPAPVVVRR